MLLLSSVDPEKFYKVEDVSKILGWSQDTVRRWIHDDLMEAFVKPVTSKRRRLVWLGVRVLGLRNHQIRESALKCDEVIR